ncbi:MAG: aminoacyl-tRNA deacylase [Chloroflexi bacterium]|nr:aminoacyl-tRNA deacylase [Chloroflexota bacterium]
MTTKLNSMRLLDKHNIPYEVIPYDDSTRDAEEIADMLGVPPFMIYKTLVVEPEGVGKKPLLVMIAAHRALDLKKLAAAAGEKKVRMAAHKDAEALTGLKVGGISALMLTHKNWPLYLDSAAAELQNLYLSAGQRGLQLRVPVTPLIGLLRAILADLSTEKS